MLFLGLRRSDAVALGRQHVREAHQVSAKLREVHAGRWITYSQHKNRNRHKVTLLAPILPELQAIIDATRLGSLTFLETAFGRPHTANGFGTWFRRRCDEAGLKQCSAHGLRKAGATIAAENGASTKQLMAIFGWRSIKQAELYTRAADRTHLGAVAMPLLVAGQRVNESVQPKAVVGDGWTKTNSK
jgi:integrase